MSQLKPRTLSQIEREFDNSIRKRATSETLKHLSAGKKVEATAKEVHRASLDHKRSTDALLRLIDRYAEAHYKVHGRVELPSKMTRELDRLAVRQPITPHPNIGEAVRRALDKHRTRINGIFEKAEEIRRKHGIMVAALSRRQGA